ncbi:right-handed parallel beta-helix repeat-containing protein, partial [candidate division WWE3 bacterium]|nr:right-handed parallel beta-helix repeat-containing protein [candidate division WWE3 bacterium]
VLVNSSWNFTQISAGRLHACAVLVNGSVACWGDNAFGQLGDNNAPTDQFSPVLVVSPWNFTQISSSAQHSCGLLVNGSVACWGDDGFGQLGDGSGDSGDQATPVLVSSSLNFSQLTSGRYHSCGLLVNGSAMCWGSDSNGQIGDGTLVTGNHYSPVLVNTTELFSQVTSGTLFSCGLLVNGSISCWGYDNRNQLGDDPLIQDKYSPVLVNSSYHFGSGMVATETNLSIATLSSNYTSVADDWTFSCTVYDTYLEDRANTTVSLPSLWKCGASLDTPGTYTMTQDIQNCTNDYIINITVDNVTLDGNGHLINGTGSYGIYVTASNVTIRNAMVNLTNSTSDYGISYSNSVGGTLEDSTVEVGRDDGIYLYITTNMTLQNNNITTNGSFAVDFDVGSHDNNFFNSRIMTGSQYGIRGLQSDRNRVENSSIITAGWHGIYVGTGSDDWLLVNVSVNITGERGIRIDGARTTVINPTITVPDQFVYVANSSLNNSLIFNTSYGQINWTGDISFNGSGTLGLGTNLDISSNNIYVNDTAVPTLASKPANLTFTGVSVSSPTPYLNGSSCLPSLCTNFLSLGNDDYSYEVAHFTNYSIGDNPYLCNIDINTTGSYVLNYDILNCTSNYIINITADNVTLDGNGHLINGTGDYGITVTGSNVTIKNLLINLTGATSSYGIYYDASDGRILDSTVEVTNQYDIYAWLNSANLNISSNLLYAGTRSVYVNG